MAASPKHAQRSQRAPRWIPKIDTRLRLAKCYEQDGKLVTAARLLRDTADDDADAARRQASIAKAAKLEAKSPKLRLALTSRPAGLVVKVDGVEVPSTEDVLVDLGPHEVVATAPGFAGRAAAPIDREGAILDVIVRMEAVEEAPTPASVPEAAPMATKSTPAPAMATTATTPAAMPAMTSERHDHRKRNGVIMTAGGAALLVGAAVLFKTSADKFDESQLSARSRSASMMRPSTARTSWSRTVERSVASRSAWASVAA